jgi:hypothetical protein
MVPSRAKAPKQSGALLLWMRVRIVRKVARVSALSDAAVKASQVLKKNPSCKQCTHHAIITHEHFPTRAADT